MDQSQSLDDNRQNKTQPGPVEDMPLPTLLARLSDDARQTFEIGLGEALRVGDFWLGVEFILMGLSKLDNGPLVDTFYDLGVNASLFRGTLRRLVNVRYSDWRKQYDVQAMGAQALPSLQMPNPRHLVETQGTGSVQHTMLTPAMLSILRQTVQWAGENKVNNSHLLLAICQHAKSPAVQILFEFLTQKGQDTSLLLKELERQIAGDQFRGEKAPGDQASGDKSPGDKSPGDKSPNKKETRLDAPSFPLEGETGPNFAQAPQTSLDDRLLSLLDHDLAARAGTGELHEKFDDFTGDPSVTDRFVVDPLAGDQIEVEPAPAAAALLAEEPAAPPSDAAGTVAKPNLVRGAAKPSKSKVAVLFTRPETVLEDYQRLIKLAGGAEVLKAGVPTILKDNITWHFPMPGANTTPWQLEGTILGLRGCGFDDLVCVQNQTVVTNAFKGEDLNGYVPIFRGHQIPVKYNFRKEDMQWVEYRPKARMLALDHIYPEGILIPDFFFDKNIVHLPTVKTHMYTTTTGAMKNAFGGLLSKYRHYTHTWIHETLVDLLAIQKEIHPGILAVMDGTTAGSGAGPRMIRPIAKNIILASEDQVAIDAVAAKLMGFDPMSIRYIRLAHEQGLGCGDPREIEMVGDNISGQSWGFKVGHNSHSFLAWLAWYGPTKVFQKLLLRSPLVAIPTLIGEIEQDYLYWPLKYRQIATKWRMESEWGALFQRYQYEGYLKK